MEVVYSEEGIHLPALDLWLDPSTEKEAAWLSHAHADHAAGGHRQVLGTPETLAIYAIRHPDAPGGDGVRRERPLPHGHSLSWRGARLTSVPASHVLGSAQILVEFEGERVVYTGDIKRREPICGTPTEIVRCDRLIIESTFGLPIFHFLDREQTRRRVVEFARICLSEGDSPVFLGYALGRGQELAHLLCTAGIPTAVHGAIARLVPVYEAAGWSFPGLEPYERGRTEGRALVVVPGFRSVLQASGKRFRFAFVSGWAALANARARTGAEELIPWSDHAGFDELVEMVEASGAGRIDVVHGYAEPFARILRERGFDAVAPREASQPLELPGGWNEDEPRQAAAAGSAVGEAHGGPQPGPERDLSAQQLRLETAGIPAAAAGPGGAEFPPGTLDALGVVCKAVASSAGRNRKVALVADYLRSLEDEELGLATLFLSGSAFPRHDRRRLSVGHITLRDAAIEVTGWDPETARLCLREVGDTAEGISLLLVGCGGEELFSLREAAADYVSLDEARKTLDKRNILTRRFKQKRPASIEWFLKVITGELRIGLQEKMVEEAIAKATGASKELVRQANNRAGDMSRVALAARQGKLETIEATLFHPMDFMLARPLDSIDTLEDASLWILEDKFDGIRAQAHVEDGRVALFSRGLEEVTATFPELAEALSTLDGSAVLDGEILGWQQGRALPFTFFQQRLSRKKVSKEMLRDVPVAFVAYDLLYRSGEMLLGESLEDRRAALERLLAHRSPPLLLAERWEPKDLDEVDSLFHQARSRANEGLMVKRRGSLYEAGKRSASWYKLKRPFGTLDVLVTAAEQGRGRRATVLSDYTFAVRDGEHFVNVGKAYSGLTDEEIRTLTRVFRRHAVQRFGRVLLVEPEVVLEVAFDGVQKSSRHKAGYSLRFPRILRWRQDKRPDEVDELERVRELYRRSLQIHEDAVQAPAPG